MPALSGQAKKKTTPKSSIKGTEVPDVRHRRVKVDFEELNEEPVANGYTLGFYGRTKTGKTTTAISLANLRLEMIPAWEKWFPLCAENLRNGMLPEINRIIIVDTEAAIKKQMGQIEQRNMFKFINGRVKVLHKAVPIKVPNSDLEDLDKGKVISDESAQLIYDKVEMIESYLEWAHDNADEHTLVIFDSASRYLDLLKAKGTIQYNRRILLFGKDSVKQEGFHALEYRKIWWNATMEQLRSTPGWVVSTFRVVPTSDYSIAVAQSKGLEPQYTKTEALKTTGFALDMEYDFDFGETDFSKHVDIRAGRWVDETDDENNNFDLTKSNRYSGLQMIENMLKVMCDPEMFGDEDEFELPPLDGDSA
jgi:hypothetical protein